MKYTVNLVQYGTENLKIYKRLKEVFTYVHAFHDDLSLNDRLALCNFVETSEKTNSAEILKEFLGGFTEKAIEKLDGFTEQVEKQETKPENDEKERAKWLEKQTENLKQHSKPPFPGKTTTKTAVPFLNYVPEEPRFELTDNLPAIYDEFLAYLKTPEGNCEFPEMIADDVFQTFSDKITCLADCIELRSHV